MPTALPDPVPAPSVAVPWVTIKVKIPEPWYRALKEASAVQGVSVSALVRLPLGPFLRGRLNGGA